MDQSDQGWKQKPAGPAADGGPIARREPSPRAAAAVGHTFIGEGAEFEGTLRIGPEGVRLDAEFKGTIITEGTVVVAQGGAVEANIHAREVVIGGAVLGDVMASRQVILRAGGRLHGDVETPCFELEKYAFFNGRSRMERPEVGLHAHESSTRSSSKADTAGAPPPQP